MIRIEMSRAFPVSVNDAFRYITELKNWNIYWPGFVQIIDSTSARWREPDDNIVLVIRLLGRDVELFMTLTDFQQDSHVFYRSSQRGLPDAQHERRWITTSDGCEYQIIVSFEPRRDLSHQSKLFQQGEPVGMVEGVLVSHDRMDGALEVRERSM